MKGFRSPLRFRVHRRGYPLSSQADGTPPFFGDHCKYLSSKFLTKCVTFTVFEFELNLSAGERHHSVAASPDSSVLSDLPPHTAKKRRASLSSLSDEEGKSSDEDEEEDKPLAARIMRGARSIPGRRTGKQPPGKKSKQSSQANGVEKPLSHGRVNGINGHTAKVKTEDKMNESQLKRLTAGVPMDTVGRSSGVSIYQSQMVKYASLLLFLASSTNRKALGCRTTERSDQNHSCRK